MRVVLEGESRAVLDLPLQVLSEAKVAFAAGKRRQDNVGAAEFVLCSFLSVFPDFQLLFLEIEPVLREAVFAGGYFGQRESVPANRAANYQKNYCADHD